jgi:hypothetical protein
MIGEERIYGQAAPFYAACPFRINWTQKTPKSATSGQHDHACASNAKRPRISLQREMAAAGAASIAYSDANDILVVFADLLSSGL